MNFDVFSLFNISKRYQKFFLTSILVAVEPVKMRSCQRAVDDSILFSKIDNSILKFNIELQIYQFKI
jgi:hypothetical protein